MTLVAALGWWLTGIPAASVAQRALGHALLDVRAGSFAVGFVSALFGKVWGVAGVSRAYETTAVRVRGGIRILLVILVLVVASKVLDSIEGIDGVTNGDLGGRLSLLIAALLMAIGIHRTIGRKLHVMPAADRRASGKSLVFYVLAATIPVVFAVLLLQGFTVGAYELVRSLVGTLLALVIVGTVRSLLLTSAPSGEPNAIHWSSLRQGRADLMHVVLTIVLVVLLIWVWRGVFGAMRDLENIPLWTTETIEGLKTVTVANLLSCLTVLGGTLVAFWALPLVFATGSMDADQRSVGSRYAIIALVRYLVLVVGLASSFSLLNIGWSKLQWMAAGLSVGLGFGLQETAANFFSGLTLLSERSIRVGDLVTVGDKTGIVSRIRLRATTLQDSDGRDIVIPNKELVTTQVTNWTLTDSKRRLQVVVGVACDSDTAMVRQKLLDAASTVGGILPDPPPKRHSSSSSTIRFSSDSTPGSMTRAWRYGSIMTCMSRSSACCGTQASTSRPFSVNCGLVQPRRSRSCCATSGAPNRLRIAKDRDSAAPAAGPRLRRLGPVRLRIVVEDDRQRTAITGAGATTGTDAVQLPAICRRIRRQGA